MASWLRRTHYRSLCCRYIANFNRMLSCVSPLAPSVMHFVFISSLCLSPNIERHDIVIHTSRLSLTPHSRLALHVSQFALVSHTSLPCLALRIRVLHFVRLRDKHEVRDMSAKCKIQTQNAKHECEVRKLALV